MNTCCGQKRIELSHFQVYTQECILKNVYSRVYTGGSMYVSTKELRLQPGRIIDQVVNGEEIVVTFRGKALARIVPVRSEKPESEDADEGIFGMWSSHDQEDSVDEMVRKIRQGRTI
jgi:prevent-host-death family protein